MFERFTERARNVVTLAQGEAERLRHGYIGTEHLLLGLVREGEGLAAQALRAAGATLERARGQVEGVVGYGEESTSHKPFTPRLKKVLELALRESMQLGHNYIGTEHILLGLVREGEGVAARVLINLDVDPDGLYREVLLMLGGAPGPVGEYGAEAEGSEMVFRAKVGSLQITARFDGQPGTLLVDLDYAYALRDTENAARVVGHDELLSCVVAALEGGELRSIESGASMVGERVLEDFPAVREITVGITGGRMLGANPVAAFTVAAFTVSRAFKR